MIYYDITVSLPTKKRIKKTKNKSYVEQIVNRKGSKFDKDKVVTVGVLIDSSSMHPNSKYFELNNTVIDISKGLNKELFDNQLSIGANLLLKKIAKDEGLTKSINKTIPGYYDLILSLLEYYMVTKKSESQLYKYYAQEHFTNLNYIPSENELSKFFNEKLSRDKISNFLETWMKERLNNYCFNNKVDIDFDSTNFNISSSNIKQAEYGKAKVDEGLPQVNVAYFLERETGLPIYYDIYYGSIIDMTHCRTAIDKLKKIKKDINASFITDKGYYSLDNIKCFSENNFNFMSMGKESTYFTNIIKENNVSFITKAKNRINDTVYGIKLLNQKTFSKSSLKFNVYLFYNQAPVAWYMSEEIDKVEKIAETLVGKKDNKEYITNTFGKMVNITKDKDNIIVSAEINYDRLDKLREKAGYFYIVSNEDLSCEEVLSSYRHRDNVEKQFKYDKSGCDLVKTYSQNEHSLEAKRLLSFIASILRASINIKTKGYKLLYSSETSQTIIEELNKIKVEKLSGRYILRYALTAKQKQILS